MYSQKVFNMALVHYLHFQRSLRKVSSIYGCSPSTLSRWVKKHARGDDPRKKASRKAKFEKIESEVARFVSENPFQRLVDIMIHLLGTTVHWDVRQFSDDSTSTRGRLERGDEVAREDLFVDMALVYRSTSRVFSRTVSGCVFSRRTS